MAESIVVINESRLKELFKEVLSEHETQKQSEITEKLYTKNQIAKRLGIAHSTISKKIEAGIIRSTIDGLIPESAVLEYLKK